MPRQTTQPPVHDSLVGPDGPFSQEELDASHAFGRVNGGVLINLVRAAFAGQFTVNVNTPAPVINCTHPGCAGGTCNVVVHTDDDNRGGTFFAFILALVGFVLTWVGMLVWTDQASWRCSLTGVIVGMVAGAAYLAVTDGIRGRWL